MPAGAAWAMVLARFEAAAGAGDTTLASRSPPLDLACDAAFRRASSASRSRLSPGTMRLFLGGILDLTPWFE